MRVMLGMWPGAAGCRYKYIHAAILATSHTAGRTMLRGRRGGRHHVSSASAALPMPAINAAVRAPVLLVTPSLRDRQRHSSAGRSG
jgi:hypothetical protein